MNILKEMYPGIPFSPPTQLAATISASETEIYVEDSGCLPDAPNYATLGVDENAEVIFYTGKELGVLKGCTRAIEGNARSWPVGTEVARHFTESDYAALAANMRIVATVAEKNRSDVNERIKKFFTNNLGETHITDSDDGYMRNAVLGGKSEQFSTTGKNLLENTSVTATVAGVTFTSNDDGSITLSGTATTDAYFHVGGITLDKGDYILSGCVNGGDLTHFLYATNMDVYVKRVEKAFSLNEATTFDVYIKVYSGITVSDIIYPMLRKAEITDDSYEPYTGGVASPNPDYPQEIESVENVGVRVTGRNLLNYEAWKTIRVEGGTAVWENNGVTITATADDCFTSFNKALFPVKVPVKEGEQITIAWESDDAVSGKVFIFPNGEVTGLKSADNLTSKSVTYTVQAGVDHILFRVGVAKAGDTISYRNIMIVKGSVPATFEPYTEQTLTVPHTLRGLPVASDGNYTDANGQQWICDEVDFERGVLVQRIGETVLDGTQTVEIADSGTTEYTRFNYLRIPAKSGVAGLCTHFRPLTTDHTQSLNSMEVHGAMNYIIFRVNVATSVNEWNAWLAANPVTTIYALVTPTEIPLSAEEIEAYKALLTHYGGTNVFFESTNGVEPNLNFDYPCAMDSFVEYIKEQMGDTRTFVYNMDSRLSDEEYLSALAYVNSEYAAALLELEV